MKDNFLFIIGICKKAGFLKSGDVAVNKEISKKRAHLVIIAGDASENTKKKYINKCNHYNIELIIVSKMDDLGKAIGKEYTAAICITDVGLSNKLKDIINA